MSSNTQTDTLTLYALQTRCGQFYRLDKTRPLDDPGRHGLTDDADAANVWRTREQALHAACMIEGWTGPLVRSVEIDAARFEAQAGR